MPRDPRDESRRPWFAVAAVTVGFLVVLVVVVYWIPRLIYPSLTRSELAAYDKEADRAKAVNDRFTLQNGVRSVLVQGIGGFLVLTTATFGGYWTYRQVLVARDGQLTDRWTKAIDQLGKANGESVDVRIGGIYALERIARNSRVDRPAVTEVLNAFVRGRVRWPPDEPGGNDIDSHENQDEDPPPLLWRHPDVQAAITVLGRGPFGPGTAVLPFVDLRNAQLGGLHLVESVFRRANLAISDLRGANLHAAWLEGAILTRADLRGANLEGARLQEADLRGADLRGAWLDNTELQGAYEDQATTWPEGFDPHARGVIRVED